MDFRLDDEETTLRDTVADFCAARYPLDEIARREAESDVSSAVWADLEDLGVFSVLVPEAAGGLGFGLRHAALVFEQLGAALVPGPLLWSSIVAACFPGPTPTPRVSGLAVEPAPGEPVLVEFAGDIDALIVLRPDGVVRIDGPTLPAPIALDALDPLTPVGRYDGIPAGTLIGGPEDAARLRAQGTVLTASMLVGVAQAALDVARNYSLGREQFGEPIATFQALKHMMADMFVRIALARSSTYAAAAVVDDPEVGDPVRSISGAKLLAGEAAIANARSAVQILGGMGFTWEMPTNHLLKRAWTLEYAFGTSTDHALTMSTELAGGGR